jgi:PAS domain S-box-containing protein
MDLSERHPPTEELLQLAAAELPVVIWQTDAELRFTASFGAALAGLKLEPGQVVGKTLFEFFQTDDADFLPIKIHREALEGEIGSQELHWSGRDYHFRVVPLRSDQGEVIGCLGIAHDISELRQSQSAQREMESRFRAITENTSDLLLIVDSDGSPKYVSPSIRRVVGYDPQEMQGRPATDFIHPDDMEMGLQTLARAVNSPGETIYLPKFRVCRSDGQYRHYDGSFTGMLGVPGVDGILVHCREVTERIRAEEEVRRSQAQWQSLVESVPNIVVHVDLEGTITFINRTLAPYTREQVIGTNYFDYVPPDEVESVRACFDEVVRTKKPAGYEGQGPDSLPFSWFAARLGPILRNGQVVALTAIFTDITDLKKTEQALRDGEETYRLLVDNQTDLVCKFGADRRLHYVSPSYCRALGMTEEELATSDFLSFIHEDDRQLVRDAVESVFRPPYSSYVEERVWTKSGWRWLAWVNTAVRNESGEVEGVIGVGRDIAERKQAEEALRASEARFRAVFDYAATGIALANLNGQQLQWNPAFREMLRYTDEEMAKIDFRDFTFPEDADEELQQIQELSSGRRDVYRKEKRYRRKDGTTFWGDLSCTVVRDDQGEARFVIGMVEDITERKRTEEELRRAHDGLELRVMERVADLAAANAKLREEIAGRRQTELALGESEERFQLAFEESPWGMTIIGPDGSWLQVNRAFCEMLGYTSDELVGMSSAQVTHPDDLQWNSELARQLVEGEIPSFNFEKRYVRKDGRLVWAAINATVVRDDEGGILYGLTMVEDVTQRKQAQQALRRAERLSSIGTLAAGIAHEVNNPLGAIQLDAETALFCIRQPDKQETVAACLSNIATSAQRGGQIVKDVLRFARSDHRPKTTADLSGAVAGALRLTCRLAEKRGVHIDYAAPEEELTVRLNTTEIEQVVVNLVTNAVQASKNGGRVSIALRRDSDTACMFVRDFGRGMSPQEADRIFDPFYTTRENEGGTGLGLSISYGIVREHDGTINVESCSGAGTTMIVRLPLAPVDAPAQAR